MISKDLKGDIMGEVIAVLKLLPSEDADFEDMVSKVKEEVDGQRYEKEAIAFGLKALKVTLKVPDGEGGTEEAEEKLKNLDEVRSVEVVGLGKT